MHVSMTNSPAASAGPVERALPLLVAFLLLLTPLASSPLLAQGLDREEAIDAIVGSDVTEEEAASDVDIQRVVAAIENSRASNEGVRKAFSLDALEIVILPDEGAAAVEETITAHQEEIEALRQSIEGSAMFYHAINSRSIMLRNVVAVEFGEGEVVTIFVDGRGP